jgi:tetratricopeptide (TPR) repeat protein
MICSHIPARDSRETPVSCSNRQALDLYEKALGQYQSYVGDPIATIDEALQHAPEFILGHLFRATVFLTMTEQRFLPPARASVDSAEALLAGANPRERGLAAAVRALVDGNWDAACASFDAVLVDYPRDAFAIQSAHLMDFYRGDSLNLRNRIARVLRHWSPSLPGYSYILGMYAFGLEECNQYQAAEEAGRRALDLQRKDGWAVHAVTHVMEMQGRTEEGIEWLESRKSDWAPDNSLAFHNWWHLALYCLASEQPDKVLSIYDTQIHPAPPDFALQLLDSTSLLWRLYLKGVDVGHRAAIVADNWANRLEIERGFYAFNDMHAMMAFVLSGREYEAERLMEGLEWTAQNGNGTNHKMTREVGLPVCQAIRAFGRGRYSEAINLIQQVRDVAHRFGGSHAQRHVLTLTLIAAAMRNGQTALAQHYNGERSLII